MTPAPILTLSGSFYQFDLLRHTTIAADLNMPFTTESTDASRTEKCEEFSIP